MAFVAVGTGLGLGAAAAAAGVGTTSAIAIGAAGASIVGSSLAAKKGAAAAQGAARTQAEAQGRAIEEQRRQFDQIREILAPYISAGRPDLTQPYIQAGPGAIRGLQALTGLGGEAARQEAIFNLQRSPQFAQLSQINQANIDEYVRNREQELELFKKSDAYARPQISPTNRGKTARRLAVKQAQEDLIAQFQQESDRNIRALQSQGYEQQQALLKPILEDKQYEQMGIDQQRQAIQQIEQGPLYQELAKQGEEAILAASSATGRRGSEGTQSALARYRPQLLNQLIDQQYARLAGLTSVGQSGAQNLLNLGQASAAGQAGAAAQSGNAISGLMASQGAAQAAGIIGSAQAQAQGIGGIGNAISGGLQNYALLNMLGSGGGGFESGFGSGDYTFGQGAQAGFMSTNV
jgi:hypothetical protein